MTLVQSVLDEVNAIESVPELTKFRPYLNAQKRERAMKLSKELLQQFFKTETFIHIPMLPEEETTINAIFQFNSRSLTGNDLERLASMLKNRQIEDVSNYLTDLQNNSIGREILCVNVTAPTPPHALTSSAPEKPSFLEKQFSVTSLKGSVSCIAIRPGNRVGRLTRILVGGCTNADIQYNWPELACLKQAPSNGHWTADILNGHFSINRRDNTYKRETVTCVQYDQETDAFYTAGYDGNIMAWDAESASLLAVAGQHSSHVNSLSCHPTRPVFAYGLNSGSLIVARKVVSAEYFAQPTTIFKKTGSTDPEVNTVDWVSIPAKGPFAHQVCTGIGYSSATKNGVVEVYDLNTASFVNCFGGIGRGLSCMDVSKCGTLVAAGSGCVYQDFKGDGIIKICQLGGNMRAGLNIQTDMYEMESVSFCPKTNFLFAGDSFKSSWAVYDLRFPNIPVFKNSHFLMRHGEAQQIEAIAHAWMNDGKYLATGGHDETVKIWDCHRSFELVKTFTFKNGIAQLEYSNNDGALVVGTDAGEVCYIGPDGLLGDDHPTEVEGRLTY